MSFQIEYQPQLIEEAVLRFIEGHPEEKRFRKERDTIYKLMDDESREQQFQILHQRWFERLHLDAPLQEALSFWPILKSYTARCRLLKARSNKEVGAELYVAPRDPRSPVLSCRSIVIQLTSELLTQAHDFRAFLRHELLHIADMLDPQFGYQPDFSKTQIGPAYERLLQERYRILWDITVDGRLCKKGWLAPAVREKHWQIFQNTFSGPTRDLEIIFSLFFDQNSHTHQELLSFARAPETWFVERPPRSKGHCALCSFPAFELIHPPTQLSLTLIDEIKHAHPAWLPTQPICRQCADLYEARFRDGHRLSIALTIPGLTPQ
jgi:hypothetical protein